MAVKGNPVSLYLKDICKQIYEAIDDADLDSGDSKELSKAASILGEVAYKAKNKTTQYLPSGPIKRIMEEQE